MESACRLCGERFPSVYYFAREGVCKECEGDGTTLSDERVPGGSPSLRDRRLWLGVGGHTMILLTIVSAFFTLIGRSLVFRGPSGGFVTFFFTLLFVALTLALGFATAAAFFTLRALDDKTRTRTEAEHPDAPRPRG